MSLLTVLLDYYIGNSSVFLYSYLQNDNIFYKTKITKAKILILLFNPTPELHLRDNKNKPFQ